MILGSATAELIAAHQFCLNPKYKSQISPLIRAKQTWVQTEFFKVGLYHCCNVWQLGYTGVCWRIYCENIRFGDESISTTKHKDPEQVMPEQDDVPTPEKYD